MTALVPIQFSSSALRDVRDIVAWYSSQHADMAGRRLAAEVVARVEQLALFPESGKVVPEFGVSWLRELEMPPFRIVYRYLDGAVAVVRVWRSERLLIRPPE